ncbi:uncharacterized protein B0H18DRAFT_992395 [Fomitopsis serialis]|uniref:uncharacterized protein n=1 Tax=Fomitopsis serialis TaxID=139415 RepID=UPI0020083964|nr:uncharacterized protein B0H18DRAFT_992395 [Neoantrodia serialis]KAH9930598.1 hypothetical protein B0H18DRAFT_992395 [Neoantrodia serialis]
MRTIRPPSPSPSADELDTYNPTTPARPVLATKPTGRPRGGSKSAAGPSSRPSTIKNAPKRTNGTAKGKQPEQIVIDSSEDELQPSAAEDVEVVAVHPPRATAKKAAGRASDTSATNKAKSTLAKGKARAEVQPPLRLNPDAAHEDDAMDVDGAHSPDENGDEPSRKRVRSGPPAKAARAAAGPNRSTKEQEAVTREKAKLAQDNEDLRKEIDTLKYERDQYSKQLEEALQIRHTEPEQALQEQLALYENMLKNQQMWQNLSNAASSSTKSQIPHFLSRDAADAEKETTEKEVRRLKDVIRQKDAQLGDKDKRISDLEREFTELRFELNQEIERGKTLAARSQTAAPVRSAVKSDGDPRNAAVIKLYEDMTNLLIISAKVEKSQFLGLDENNFTCVYTHTQSDSGSNEENASLSFTLHEQYGHPDGSDASKPVQSKKELIRKCKYAPQTLPGEEPEFFQRLDYFREPFLFSWDQLTVFLKTLTEKMAEAVNPEGDEDEDDELKEDEGARV